MDTGASDSFPREHKSSVFSSTDHVRINDPAHTPEKNIDSEISHSPVRTPRRHNSHGVRSMPTFKRIVKFWDKKPHTTAVVEPAVTPSVEVYAAAVPSAKETDPSASCSGESNHVTAQHSVDSDLSITLCSSEVNLAASTESSLATVPSSEECGAAPKPSPEDSGPSVSNLEDSDSAVSPPFEETNLCATQSGTTLSSNSTSAIDDPSPLYQVNCVHSRSYSRCHCRRARCSRFHCPLASTEANNSMSTTHQEKIDHSASTLRYTRDTRKSCVAVDTGSLASDKSNDHPSDSVSENAYLNASISCIPSNKVASLFTSFRVSRLRVPCASAGCPSVVSPMNICPRAVFPKTIRPRVVSARNSYSSGS
ncbi:uncharacterized protein LOC144756317 isoform X2 [Lissotriton helveticus]